MYLSPWHGLLHDECSCDESAMRYYLSSEKQWVNPPSEEYVLYTCSKNNAGPQLLVCERYCGDTPYFQISMLYYSLFYRKPPSYGCWMRETRRLKAGVPLIRHYSW